MQKLKLGLYDNMKLQRRELYLEWEGKEIFYGWCEKNALTFIPASSFWKSDVPFGNFPIL
jgi:hypothetical protein